MSAPSNDLIKFVNKILTEVEQEAGVARVELFHTIEGEGADRITTLKNLSESTAEMLTEAVWDAAEGDAKTRTAGMIQRYAVHAFSGAEDSDGMPEHTFAFTLTGGLRDGMFDADSEPATPAGRLKQDMRHTENLHRMLIQQTEYTAGRLARDYDFERKARLESENRYVEVAKLHQDLLDRQHERDMSRAKEVQSAQRTDQVLGLLMSMAPLILMKFMPQLSPPSGGAGSAPAGSLPGIPMGEPEQQSGMGSILSGNPRSIALGQILLSIPKEKAMQLISSLSQFTQIAVMQLIQSYKDSPPGSDKSADDARDLSIKHLLKNLSQQEMMSIVMSLDGETQNMFFTIYKSYQAEEARAEAERPEILKQQPKVKNGKSNGDEEEAQA